MEHSEQQLKLNKYSFKEIREYQKHESRINCFKKVKWILGIKYIIMETKNSMDEWNRTVSDIENQTEKPSQKVI